MTSCSLCPGALLPHVFSGLGQDQGPDTGTSTTHKWLHGVWTNSGQRGEQNYIKLYYIIRVIKFPTACSGLTCACFSCPLPQNSDVRSQFQEFLSLNGHQLEQRPFPDVVQLALSQPQTSEVYRQALQQARERTSRGKLYFDWLYAIWYGVWCVALIVCFQLILVDLIHLLQHSSSNPSKQKSCQ